MCRNIKTLFNFDPPATDEEIRAAAVQFVRKVAGGTKPSKANAAACEQAVAEIEISVQHLLANLVTTAPAKNREVEIQKARVRNAQRFQKAS